MRFNPCVKSFLASLFLQSPLATFPNPAGGKHPHHMIISMPQERDGVFTMMCNVNFFSKDVAQKVTFGSRLPRTTFCTNLVLRDKQISYQHILPAKQWVSTDTPELLWIS